MPRKARVLTEMGLYHIVMRGVNQQDIFLSDRYFIKYLDILDYCKKECGFELLAYCLMTNHIHLLIHVKETPMETIFRRINTTYAMWFNKKSGRTGVVLQGRYHSEPIKDQRHLLMAVLYIHYNPVKAGLEKHCGEKYRWSSFQKIRSNDWRLVDGGITEGIFGGLEGFLTAHKTYDDAKANFLDIDNMPTRIMDKEAREILFDISKCRTPEEFQELSLTEQHRCIAEARSMRISIRQLSRLTGISKGRIQRM